MMSENEKLAPKRRFKEFQNTNSWEQEVLGNVADIYDGTHQTPKYTDGGVMFLSVENIKNLTSEKFISQEAFECEFKVRPERNDVLMTRIGDIGTANIVQSDENIAYYVSLALLKPTKVETQFLATSIATPFIQEGLWKRTLHIAFPKKINKNEIVRVKINVPNIEEQKKIGEFFSNLDHIIAIHQRKLEKTKALKAAYLSEMFPAAGEHKPKRRFQGFADDWEQRRLKDIAPLQRGFDLPKDKMTAGSYPVVMSNGINGYHSEYKVKGPGVVTGRSGTIGNVHYIDCNYWPHNTALWVTDFKGNHPHFIYYLYQKLNLNRFGTGSGVPTLNRNDIHSEVISVPSYEEQKIIAEIFCNFDQLITLHQRNLEKLQNVKKAYLNEMFIGGEQ